MTVHKWWQWTLAITAAVILAAHCLLTLAAAWLDLRDQLARHRAQRDQPTLAGHPRPAVRRLR